MFAKLSAFRVDFRQLSPLFYASLGALLALLITAFVLTERTAQKKLELLSDFGETIVEMAARELVDPAVNEDLVSMHAVLQSLTGYPRVAVATVENLERQLLVQAGKKDNLAPSQEFTAKIATPETVEGYITIEVLSGFPGDTAVRWTLVATAGLLALMLLLTLYESRGRAWYCQSDDNDSNEEEPLMDWNEEPFAVEPYDAQWQATDNHFEQEATEEPYAEYEIANELDDEYVGGDETDSPAVGESKPFASSDDTVDASSNKDGEKSSFGASFPSEAEEGFSKESPSTAEYGQKPQKHRSDLILVLANYPRLEKQLNRERFTQLITGFEQGLGEVLDLYDGEQLGAPHNNNIYCLRFTSKDSASEAAFRAASCAYLVERLNDQNSIRFNLVAEVCHPDEDVKLAVSQQGIFLQTVLVDDLLRKRLLLNEMDDGRIQLQGFNAPFASLLERQQQQLLAPA